MYYDLLKFIIPNTITNDTSNNSDLIDLSSDNSFNKIQFTEYFKILNEKKYYYYALVYYGINITTYNFDKDVCKMRKDHINDILKSNPIDSNKDNKIYNIIIIYLGQYDNINESIKNSIKNIQTDYNNNKCIYLGLDYEYNTEMVCRIICIKYKHKFRGTKLNTVQSLLQYNESINY